MKNLSPELRRAWRAIYSVYGDETTINEIERITGIELGKLVAGGGRYDTLIGNFLRR